VSHYASSKQILSTRELAHAGALFAAVDSASLDHALLLLKDTVGRYAVYLDVSSLSKVQDVVDLLDAGAAKVIVSSGQVPEIKAIPNLDASRIIYLPTVSSKDAEEQIQGTGFGLYLRNVESAGKVGSTLSALGKGRPPVYVSKENVTEEEAVELCKQQAVPIIASKQLTVNAEAKEGEIRIANLLLANVVSDRSDGLFTTLVVDERGVALG
ncbi:Histidine biosynthesis trifunctional, partial [Hortaea werneckii]